MDENKVRIADVAEELGLSTATVSNVLHGKTHKMSEATIKRVERKAGGDGLHSEYGGNTDRPVPGSGGREGSLGQLYGQHGTVRYDRNFVLCGIVFSKHRQESLGCTRRTR